MADKETKETLEELNALMNTKRTTNENISHEAAGDNVSEGEIDTRDTDERHNANARAAAAIEQENPRINTDNL